MDHRVADVATHRLRLRRVTFADTPALVAIDTDPRTNEHRPGRGAEPGGDPGHRRRFHQ